VRAGEYALTRLAAAVVEYFLTDEALTRESLTLLTGTLRAQLAEILAAARKAEGGEGWRSKVTGPLAALEAMLLPPTVARTTLDKP
jgi:chromosome partition protein MukF